MLQLCTCEVVSHSICHIRHRILWSSFVKAWCLLSSLGCLPGANFSQDRRQAALGCHVLGWVVAQHPPLDAISAAAAADPTPIKGSETSGLLFAGCQTRSCCAGSIWQQRRLPEDLAPCCCALHQYLHTPVCCYAGSTSQQRQLGPPLSETLEASVSTAMLATFRSHNNGGISQPSLNTLESETQALLAQCSAQGPHDWGVAPSVSLNDSLLDDLLVPGLNMGQFDF